MSELPPIERGPDAAAWHAVAVDDVCAQLGVAPEQGLTEAEVARRREAEGANELVAYERTPWWRVLARQFADALIGILVVAAVLSALIGELGDALTIAAILAINGVLGFVQEWRAERALEALQAMIAPRCRALRDGRERAVEATALVRGDVVRLGTGDRVPADLRVVQASELRADESALTGESAPVRKEAGALPAGTPLAERSNLLHMGTAITAGRGVGVVVATGMGTELGQVATLTGSVGGTVTPLQIELGRLGRLLGVVGVGLAVLAGGLGWLHGEPLTAVFLTGVALAVAVVPEGLPAVVTITLALGVREMMRRRALLRRLQAAETLGEATTICSDKTGTLTRNQMTVQEVWLPSGALEVTGVGYAPQGELRRDGRPVPAAPDVLRLAEAGAWCSDATLDRDGERWVPLGAPTEAALVALARKLDVGPPPGPVVADRPFEARRKRMSRAFDAPGGVRVVAKGAPELMLPCCTRLLDGDVERPLDEAARAEVLEAVKACAAGGLRTLAVADRRLDAPPAEGDDLERDLVLLGFVGIIDPPGEGVAEAIARARSAGIRTLMITGDSPVTALAVARRVGLTAARAVTGPELDGLDDAGLRAVIDEGAVFARTTPEHKLRLVTALQAGGEVVAMTGDGVNDAPALKQADIGVAMGLRGTEVARGAADILLTDDNYASIVAAVEEGRRQYDSIQKFVRYLLSSNTGEVVAIVGNVVVGGPLVLLPVQILWMNLVTDGVTAVALGAEPAEEGLMTRPPRGRDERLLDGWAIAQIAALGGYVGLATLWLYHDARPDLDVDKARTMAFTGLVVLEKINVLNFRSLRAPLHTLGVLSNPWLLIAWLVTLGLQVATVYAPPLQALLHTVPLTAHDWLTLLAVALPVFLVPEAFKLVAWWRRPTGPSRRG